MVSALCIYPKNRVIVPFATMDSFIYTTYARNPMVNPSPNS